MSMSVTRYDDMLHMPGFKHGSGIDNGMLQKLLTIRKSPMRIDASGTSY